MKIKRILKGASVNTLGFYGSYSDECSSGEIWPRLVVFSTYSELSDAGDSIEKYRQTLNTIPFRSACGTLSAINLILSGGVVDPEAHKAANKVAFL